MRFFEWFAQDEIAKATAPLKADNERLELLLRHTNSVALEYQLQRDEARARIVELTRGRCTCVGCGREVNNAWRDSDGHWCLTCLAKSRDGARRISEHLRSGNQHLRNGNRELCATNARLREEVEQGKIALRFAQVRAEEATKTCDDQAKHIERQSDAIQQRDRVIELGERALATRECRCDPDRTGTVCDRCFYFQEVRSINVGKQGGGAGE